MARKFRIQMDEVGIEPVLVTTMGGRKVSVGAVRFDEDSGETLIAFWGVHLLRPEELRQIADLCDDL